MSVGDEVFSEAIPRLYDAVLGPFMFEPFARVTAERLAGLSGEVLEIAAGTGIVTRELDRRLAPSARLTASDLNAPMLALAAERLRSPRVVWRQADALDLPFAAASFDAVVCQFGAMFFPDRGRAYAEAGRVLRPGGRYLVSVWDSLAANPVAQTVHQAIAGCFPNDPPQFLARTPHGHHDAAKLRAELGAAGFVDVRVETVTLEAGRLTPDELAFGFCQGTPVRHEIAARDPAGLARTTATVAAALSERFGDSPVVSPISAHLATAEASREVA